MWRLCVLGAVAGCYTANPVAGAPCTPAHPACPEHQFCAAVGSAFACVASIPDDAAIDTPDVGFDAPDGPTPHWSLIQGHESTGRTIAIEPPALGNLVVVAIQTNAIVGGAGNLSDDAGNSYALINGTQARSLNNDISIELWSATITKPDARMITVGSGSVRALVIWEVAGLRTENPVDTASKLDDQGPSATPSGAPITTAAAGELVFSIAGVSNTITGIQPGNEFTNDFKTKGSGWAHLTDPAAPAGLHTAIWTQPSSGRYCAASVAFVAAP